MANELNQIGSAGGVGIGWTLDGNMSTDGVNTYTRGYGNRMIGASRSGMTATYDYDSDDRRTLIVLSRISRTPASAQSDMATFIIIALFARMSERRILSGQQVARGTSWGPQPVVRKSQPRAQRSEEPVPRRPY